MREDGRRFATTRKIRQNHHLHIRSKENLSGTQKDRADSNQGSLTFELELISICCAENSSVRGRGRMREMGQVGDQSFLSQVQLGLVYFPLLQMRSVYLA